MDSKEKFLEMIKLESTFHRYLKRDVINRFIVIFNGDYENKKYSKEIDNPLDFALQFYKDYNVSYYQMILKGIEERKIIISKDINQSFVDTFSGGAFIELENNDSDIFKLVHEFAHFIDRNLAPSIIPDEYYFLSEVFSFYMEKKLEIFLEESKYSDLIATRRNNRVFFESKMMKVVAYVLKVEDLYKDSDKVSEEFLDSTRIKKVMNYDYDLNVGIVNYLLQYPLANVLSSYLLSEHGLLKDQDIFKACLDTNLYEALESKTLKKIF